MFQGWSGNGQDDLTDQDYEFDPLKDLWIPGRRRFFFQGLLGATAAALGLSSVQEIPKAVIPKGLIPTASQEPGSALWTVRMEPNLAVLDESFPFMDTGFKVLQRDQSHLQFWKKTRRHVAVSYPKGYELKAIYIDESKEGKV